MSIETNAYLQIIPGFFGLLLATFAFFRPRSRTRPKNFRWEAFLFLLLLGLLSCALAPQPNKGWLALAGVLFGGVFAFLHSLPRLARNRLFWLGTLLFFFSAARLLIPDPLLFSYLALGLLLGIAVPSVFAVFEKDEGSEIDFTAALSGILTAALVWGQSLGHAQGSFPLFVLLICALFLCLAEFLDPKKEALVSVATVLLIAFAAWMTANSLFSAPALFYPLSIGLLLALSLLFILRLPGPLVPLSVLLISGMALLLANRLFGSYGVSLAGLGLLAIRPAGIKTEAVVLTVFAARPLLQLFLLRTGLNEAGVDITKTYAFAALFLAVLLPFVLGATRRFFREDRLFSGIVLLAILLLPGFAGFFLHIEALAALLAGGLILALVFGLTEESDLFHFPSSLVLSGLSFSLLLAPWFMQVINLPRLPRLIAFLVLAFVFSACLIFASFRSSRRFL